jgi:(+)-trans-carveol dehydrogenase
MEHIGHNVAAKHGVTGVGKALAQEVAPHEIRVNTIHPRNCPTDMLLNVGTRKLFRPDLDEPSVDDVVGAMRNTHLFDVPWVEARDVTEALLYLVSDSGRYVTGIQLPIDAGLRAR